MSTVAVIREETLTFSGEISGDIARGALGSSYDTLRGGDSDGSAGSPIGSITWNSHSMSGGVGILLIGWQVSCLDVTGASDSDSAYTSQALSGAGFFYEATATGSWEITAACELVIEHTGYTDLNTRGIAADPPHDYKARIYYRTKAGGAATATVSMGGATASTSSTIGSSVNIAIKDVASIECHAEASASASPFTFPPVAVPSYSRSASMTMSWRNASSTRSASVSGTYGSASSNTDSITCTGHVPGGATGGLFAADANLNVSPHKAYDIDAQIRAMSEAYPADVDLEWLKCAGTTDDVVASGGSWGDGYIQRNENGQVWIDTATVGVRTTDSFSYDDFGPLSLTIKSAWATTRKELTSDRQVPFKDRAMAGLTLSQIEEDELASGSDSASSSTSFTRTWSPAERFMGSRYLRIRVDCDSASPKPFKVTIGSKEWTKDRDEVTLVASTTAVAYTLDLLLPTNITTEIDPTDTTYPLLDIDDGPRTEGGDFSGVCGATEIVLSADDATVFGLYEAELLETGENSTYAVPGHTWGEMAPETEVSESGTVTEHFKRPWLEITTDGRLLSIEQTDCRLDKTTTNPGSIVTYTLYEYSLQWLHDNIRNDVRTWSVTLDAPAPGTGLDAYYNTDRELWGLWGGGAMFISEEWQYHFDESPGSMAWQGAFTDLDFTGQVGDIFGFDPGHATFDTPLKAAKVLGNQGEALVIDSLGGVPATEEITLTQASAGRGSDDTNGLGVARTGLDFGRADDGTVTITRTESGLTATYSPEARKRFHVRFWVPLEEPFFGLALVHGFAGYTLLARDYGGKIQVRRWPYPVFFGSPTLTVNVTSGPNETLPALCRPHFGTRIELMFIRPAGAYSCCTDDDGETWSIPTLAFADATCVAPIVDSGGGVLRAAIVEAGGSYVIKGTYQSPGDAGPSSTFTVQRYNGSTLEDLMVENVRFGLVAAPYGTAAILLTCVLEGDTTETNLVSYDEGRTFQ